ncbi:MAG: sigma-54-dependent Fis family transcriptional regulator [Candidatus Omnitrophica bacterium]|nr:sigma-54-dependent Fis family transcriptional regulator [Candidatus Omnitrophota bacterium]
MEPFFLVVDDEEHSREGLRDYLEGLGYDVQIAANAPDALGIVKKQRPDIVITDLKMPQMDGLELLEEIMDISPETMVVVLTAYGTVETAVKAMKSGAFHYLTKPVNFEELELVLKKALSQQRLEQENRELREALADQRAHDEIVGKSEIIVDLIRQAERVAPTNASILIEGESGTGKELFARLIHNAGPRSRKPFVAVHCAALTDTLLTSELFGHERGSFTGATERKIGRFERAHEGTLFLDEIAELKEDVQVKLLRVLQDGNFERVGGFKTIHADIRLICATNKNLSEEVKKGRFREDLFYRINVVKFTMPALRDRRDDIPMLVEHFLKYYAAQNRKGTYRITPQAAEVLQNYRWPGNIRELRNTIERMVVLGKSEIIDVDQIPIELKGEDRAADNLMSNPNTNLRGAEKILIEDRLKQYQGNKSKAARALGISRRTLYRKMEEYKINP